MKNQSCLKCGLLLIVSASAYTLVTKVTPVQKVLQMMGEMKVTAEKMKAAEAKTFREYANWADDQQTELGFEIKTGKSEIEKLNAFIESSDLDVEKFGKQVTGMENEIDRMETEQKDATTLRKEESGNFMKTQQDLAESVDAIGKAQDVLQSGAQDKEQATALLQSMATTVPKMPLVMAFLEEDEVGAPAAAGYKSQSGEVLQMLQGLKEKFKKELDETELEESNKAHAYELEMQHLGDTITATKADLSGKQSQKGKTAADSAKAKGELLKTKDELDEDEKMLVEVTSTFRTKTDAFKVNQKTRTDELAAISKAIEIISSPAVSQIQVAQKATSLLQTQSSEKRVALRQQASSLLEQRAEVLSSSTLKSFAKAVAGSPFVKVIGMVNDLIAKLKEEASAEQEHKQWCDDQLKTNKLKRETQGTKADQLEASLEKLAGQIDTMGKEIQMLVAEQGALTKAQSKATDIRGEEKARNTQTVKDSAAGAEATKQALTVLKEFYSSQAFIQQAQAPELEKFKGQQGAGKGVIGMLEVVESDFLRLKAETSADEKQAQEEYDKFMGEATKDKGEKHGKETKLKLDKDKAENDQSLQKKDLKLTNEKLGDANKYFESLKPTCVEIHVDFAERAARRKEEIEALEEAYGILDKKSSDE